MATPTPILSLGRVTAGNNAGWEDDVNGAMATLDVLSAGANVFYVDKSFTTAALGNAAASSRRHFPTIQEAINAAQGPGYARKTVIKIAPDDYYERLVIGNSITLMGEVPINYFGMGGARGAEIHGDGTQNPTFTIVPPAGGGCSVNLIHLNLENVYSAQAAFINKPYLVDFRSDNAIGAANYFGMLGCVCRCQTWGDDNEWDSALSLAGYLSSTLEHTHVWGMNYAGGNFNGGIRNLLKLRGVFTGVPANDKVSWLQVRNGGLFQSYAGAGSPLIWNNDNGSGGRMVRTDASWAPGSIIAYGANGVNSAVEGCGSDFGSRGNIQGFTITI
jgi:hypothetical protein